MPFTAQEMRAKMARPMSFLLKPGDKCFFYYVIMMHAWEKQRSWTTADTIYEWVGKKERRDSWQRAKELAWQVFFALEVMPLEYEKKSLNGGISGNERIHPWVFKEAEAAWTMALPATPEALNEEGKI